MNFMFSWQEQYLTPLPRSLVRYCSCHESIKFIYYIDESVLLGTKPLVDSIRHFIRDPSGAFSVCHLCECHIVQWHQVCLLNVLKLVGVSSKHLRVFLGSVRQSSEIFGHLRKFSEIIGKCSETFVWYSEQSSEIFGRCRKSSENHQKRRHQHVYIIKRTLHGGLKIWILFSRGKNNILLTRCARS